MMKKKEFNEIGLEGSISNEKIFSESFFKTSCNDLAAIASSEMIRLEVNVENQTRINDLLNRIKTHHLPTYGHCLRVGILADRVGNEVGLASRPLLLSGLIHDYGKIGVDVKILDKTEGFSEDDFGKVRPHVLDGYNLLKSQFLFSAEILARHHSFNENPYPEIIPENHILSKDTMAKVDRFARFLALIDFYDAICSRENTRYKEKLSPEKRKQIILEKNADIADLIEELYQKKILCLM